MHSLSVSCDLSPTSSLYFVRHAVVHIFFIVSLLFYNLITCQMRMQQRSEDIDPSVR